MKNNQFEIPLGRPERDAAAVRRDAIALYRMWKSGLLGGERMPEDVHPSLSKDSRELLHFFTLGMCLNYQRNSYSLWDACARSFEDNQTSWIFDPVEASRASADDLRSALLKHKVALQPNKHVDNWRRVSGGIVEHAGGDMRQILAFCDFDIARVREFVQTRKVSFPYLAGLKICNYWLFVLLQYTSFPLTGRAALNIAPDTHVVNASLRLGVISPEEFSSVDAPIISANAWAELLLGTELLPIDIHTPLWLWSRLKFPNISHDVGS